MKTRFPKPIRKVLKNGIRVVAVPMLGNPTVTVMVLVEAGSRYENKKENGISHFLEHMCFKGTHKRPSSKIISHEFDALGAENNAFTGEEQTGYWAKARTKHFDHVLAIVADLYQDPLLPEKELEKERGVIIQEINMYEDLPQRRVHELLDEVLYGNQAAGRSIGGPKENILRFSRADFVTYRNTHYTGAKTAVIVAGGISQKDIFKKVTAAFTSVSKGSRAQRPHTKEAQKRPKIIHKHKKTDQTHFIVGFRGYKLGDEREASTRVLASVLGQGMSSRLFHLLREEMGVCYYVRAGSESMTDTGVFKISSGVDTKRLSEVIEAIMGEIRTIRKNLVSPEELAKAKEILIGRIVMGLESSDDMATWYSDEILHQPLKTPEEIIVEIKKVTPKMVQAIARDVFANKKLNIAYIGPRDATKQLKKIARI
ncbi:MAG: pitrilysin family protein [Patescibacteria group bacterium]